MSRAKELLPPKHIHWTSGLIRDLRGKRSQAEFAQLVGVAKNTVWRWESGYAEPDLACQARLTEIAAQEDFLAGWQLVGSITRIGNLEKGSGQIAKMIEESITRTGRSLK